MCKSERKSATGLWIICSPSLMFHNDKIKYSTSTIKTERDRHIAKKTAIKRRQENVGGKSVYERMTERENRRRYEYDNTKQQSGKISLIKTERGEVA